MEKSRPVVRSLWAGVHKRRELGLKGQGSMKKCTLTARTEMRNCLFAPVGGGGECNGTIVSTSRPNSISKAVL